MKPELEEIKLGVRQSILAFHYEQRRFDAPWHFHPQYELTYIKASHGTKFIGDFVGPYEPEELVLLGGNLPHCWKDHAQQEGLASSTVVQWNEGIFAKVPELEGLFRMFRVAARGIIFTLGAKQNLLARVDQLPILSAEELYVTLLSLLVDLSACEYATLSNAKFRHHLPPEYSSRMAKIHDFIELHYQRKIYLHELAALVNMSEQSFSRFFSKMMGRPFFSFLNEYRINVAGRMLIDTEWSVAQIAYACGYESLPFFHKQFNKFKAETPSRYRKRYVV
ncbi:MAG: AraC family transcriptional regulator [Bacteroidota bacterium]